MKYEKRMLKVSICHNYTYVWNHNEIPSILPTDRRDYSGGPTNRFKRYKKKGGLEYSSREGQFL
jgi:hypothetical protein